MPFNSLPDDILLQLFTSLDFRSTISLRQTCRRCYEMSKAKAVWLDSFRWLTRDSEDWRALLNDSPASRSSQYLEDVVTKMVRFETNWNNGQLRGFRRFLEPAGWVAALVPGGRWFLASFDRSLGTLVYYDLDSRVSEMKSRVLVEHHQEGWTIWTMDFTVDPTAARFEFDLALELATDDQLWRQASGPRKIAIWRVKLNHNDELVAEPTCSFNVFRASTFLSPISLQGDFLLRTSNGPSNLPVYAVHRWRGLGDGVVSHSLLLPQAKQIPQSGARLLPDGRIVSIFIDRVELHAHVKECWEEGPFIPRDMPRVPPQWVFEYKPPIYRLQFSASRLMYYPKFNSVVFSLHNAESLFTFRIVTDQDSLPEVTTMVYGLMEDREYIGLSTSHAIRNRPGRKEAVLVTFPGSAQLHSFAGVTNQTSNAESREPHSVTETLFKTPLPSGGGSWEVEERSGRVLCTLNDGRDYYAVLYI